jgi:GNAT superfamily N-acetyltransferase
MHLRLMTEQDIAAGMRLKEIAGWNQTAEDWKRFLNGSPSGCFVAEADGKVCGTATTIVYENRFAWIGMVLVHPEYRSRGFGTRLLERAIQHLDERKVPTLKLDATPQGKPIYERLGFVPEYEVERWTLKRGAESTGKAAGVHQSDKLSAKVFGAILTKDKDVFGASRGCLLEDLNEHAPELTVAIENRGLLTGYTFGRHGSFADHLGPWYATNPSAAPGILQTFLARSRRETIIVDCVKENPMAGALLRSTGFTYSRPLTRMFRGTNSHPGQAKNLCAILGPEFG